MKATISEKEIRKHLSHASIPLYIFDDIDSTNSFAKALKEDCALVVANSQSQGRGRLNRCFYSPKGTGVYMTLLIKPQSLYQNVMLITTAAACALHAAIDSICGVKTQIKWVNDIYLEGKKVAGILCEIVDDSRCVIGIGVNLYPSSLPRELEDIAAFIMDKNNTVMREELIAAVTDNLLSILSALSDCSFMEYYKANSCVLGQRVLCTDADRTFEATAVDIDSAGGLLVMTDNGLQTLRTGEITLRVMN